MSQSVSFQGPFDVEQGGLHNINVEYHEELNGELTIVYGSCTLDSTSQAHHQIGRTHIGSHPAAKRHLDWEEQRPTKFVWVTPSDVISGCLHAFVDGGLVGRSQEFSVTKRKLSRRATLSDVAEPLGAWFDGVTYMSQKEPDEVFVAATKKKSFGILGGGMSGLMTSLLLESVGIHNWKIIESSGRVGGRVRTTYLNNSSPEDHQYSELGPMRFPHSLTDPDTNATYQIMDHRMVYQLADILNGLNAGNESLQVNFIPWIQSSDNTPVTTTKRRPDGTFPGKSEVANDPRYATETVYSNATAVAEAEEALDEFKGLTSEKLKLYASNVFKAHKQANEEGLFDFSEVEYLRYVMKTDLNVTDEVASTTSISPMWEYETVYFMADTWRTIDGGLSRLPAAFENLVKDRVVFNSKIHSVKHNSDNDTLTVSYRPLGSNPREVESSTEEFDYIFNTVPLNLLRFWELPAYSSLMRRAIERYNFGTAAKIAIQYETRFWEHLDYPIYGGCGRVGIPLIGQICYPPFEINSTGPGVLLATYISGSDANTACAMTDAQHVAYVQQAVVDIHGSVAEDNWTGNWDRQCWMQDEHHAGSWASPITGQQQLYIPAFWRTEFNTVFIGEHTSYTHAWIFSALESATRGTVQMLLDLGLVDEAKQITQTWMARWITL
ncbi:L-amino-acid oxidase [Dactylonectria estremocensis]|uniref:L-amino-acid oxidase n=1 Tax=Dactylonectria estremocensis TaxID=1079267 RepID=A0A9P9F3R8_9HYPO|nr:L-amino-acid oxidase [Dactylonectria estremocensis]